jgi:hypothetical protein
MPRDEELNYSLRTQGEFRANAEFLNSYENTRLIQLLFLDKSSSCYLEVHKTKSLYQAVYRVLY